MELLPLDLKSAALSARDLLGTFARNTALAGTSPGGGAHAAMAGAAQAAIFADALLGAMRARFEELRAVTK